MKNDRWFDWTEYALLLGSGAGAVASVVTQQAFLAAAPLSLLAALGLVSRRQVQTKVTQNQSVMLSINGRLDQGLHDVNKQLEDLPTHDQLRSIRRSIVAQNRQDILSLSQVIEQTRKKLTAQIDEKKEPDLQGLRQSLSELQEGYTELSVSLKDVKLRCQQMSDTSRIKATETTIAKLETELMQLRVHLEALGVNAKNNYTGLHDKLTYLRQQVQQLTTEERQSLLKEDVQELVKTVSEMVSRDEFLELSTKLTEGTADKLILQELHTQTSDKVERLQRQMELLGRHLDAMSESMSAALVDPAGSAALVPEENGEGGVTQLQQRVEAAELQMNTMTDSILEAVSETLDPLRVSMANQELENRWLLDFASSGERSNSRQALEQLIAQAHERLVLVWPWSDDWEVDDGLLQQFRWLLERNCRLDIGWCHQGDNYEHPLLRNISQRWSEYSGRQQQLKGALNQLLPLKQEYPALFSFKILGTTENFAVCDSTCAVIGMQALATQTSLFPMVKLKLCTTDLAVVQSLVQRFDHSAIATHDSGAYFNRGITRYDIRDYTGAIADFTQVINIAPNAAAHNCRGVALFDLGDRAAALQDFGHAIRLDAHLFAARCNRGVLRMELRDYEGAIDDLVAAATLSPRSAIPHFYQGQAYQFLADLRGAIEQFSQAIERQPDVVLPYCYRAAVYQRQGNLRQAVTDLEMAARLLQTAGDINNLKLVMHKLEMLKVGTAAIA